MLNQVTHVVRTVVYSGN